jgi:hypothetical protein
MMAITQVMDVLSESEIRHFNQAMKKVIVKLEENYEKNNRPV